MTSDIINYSSSPRHYQPNYSVKQECSTVTAAPLTATPVDGRFTVQDLSPPSASSYWTPSSEQLVTCVVGHPSGSTASSLSSFVDDESTSYEDITYNNYGRPSSVAALQAAAAASAVVTNCADYSDGLYHHHHVQHHHQYGSNVVGGGYYESGAGYGDQLHQHQHHHHQHHLGYNDKPPSPPPPYDNNNAADACDMNVTATVGYDDPYVTRLDGQPAQQYHQHVHLQQQQQQQQINDTESDDTERLQQQRRMHCAPDSVGCLQRRTEAALQHPVPVPVVRVVKRRNTANKKERRRTQSINNAFSDLRDCIPNVPSDTKLSKIKTLRLATSYISYLMDVLDSEDPDTDGFKADLSAHTTRRSSTTQQHATAASAAVTAIASRNKSQQQTIGTRLPMDPNNDHHHQQHRENQYHLHKRGKGRTGWPQDVWALELKQEQV